MIRQVQPVAAADHGQSGIDAGRAGDGHFDDSFCPVREVYGQAVFPAAQVFLSIEDGGYPVISGGLIIGNAQDSTVRSSIRVLFIAAFCSNRV